MINTININTAVLERFTRLQQAKRLAHAYLFVGSMDAGKTQTALSVAQLVNCEAADDRPCGQCASCNKIANGNHPDVYMLGPDDEAGSIKIDAIRFLLSRVQLRPFEAKKKVFIIRDVEQMTLEAANALLKTLEEPSMNTLMILTTSLPEANLDTIRSRCHTVQFFPVSVNRIAEVLAQEGVEARMASFVAVYADGCLGKARKLASEGILLRKNRIIDQMLFSARSDEFLKELSGDKVAVVEALNVMMSFFRDVILLKSAVAAEGLIHQDRINDLKAFAVRPMTDLAAIISQIVQTKKLINDNLNVKMSLALLKERMGN